MEIESDLVFHQISEGAVIRLRAIFNPPLPSSFLALISTTSEGLRKALDRVEEENTNAQDALTMQIMQLKLEKRVGIEKVLLGSLVFLLALNVNMHVHITFRLPQMLELNKKLEALEQEHKLSLERTEHQRESRELADATMWKDMKTRIDGLEVREGSLAFTHHCQCSLISDCHHLFL